MFEKKEKIYLGVFLFVILSIILGFFSFQSNRRFENEDTRSYVIVHIAGEVKNPGVYKLEDGARVVDVLNLAGGPLPSADLDKINLADFLRDGAKIYIPPRLEIIAGSQESQGIKNIHVSQDDIRVNINTATREQLETLPGIGATLAQRIIDYRNENGFFSSPEDLLKVKGIGEKKLEKLKDKITW